MGNSVFAQDGDAPLTPVSDYGTSYGTTGTEYAAGEPISAAAQTPRVQTARSGWNVEVHPYVETSATYSSNVDLLPDGQEEEELVLSAGAGIRATADSRRLRGWLDYSGSYDYYTDREEGEFRNGLSAGAATELVPNFLFLDGRASIDQSYYHNQDRFSFNGVANPDDRTTVYSASLSPSIQKNLGGWAQATLRYTIAGSLYDEDDEESGDSSTYDWGHGLAASLASDPATFRRFGWAVTAGVEQYDFEDNPEDAEFHYTGAVQVDVPVTSRMAITGTVGYDGFENVADDDEYSGAYGNVGVRFVPSNRLSAIAHAGYRYNGFDYGVGVDYALRDNLRASINAGRGVEFGTYGDLIDSDASTFEKAWSYFQVAGKADTWNDNKLDEQFEAALVDTISASLAGSTGKTNYTITGTGAFYDYHDAFAKDKRSLGLSLSVARALTHRMNLDGGISYVYYDEDGDDEDLVTDEHTLGLTTGISYALTKNLNGFARYTYTTRFADHEAVEYDEHAGTIGLRASF